MVIGHQVEPLGVVLAVVFLVGLSSLFLWMFHLPPILPQEVVAVRRTVKALKRILVPVVETVPAERAVELACRLGHDQSAEIILAYVVEVPLTLPINATLPAQEAAGQHALATAEMLVRAHHLVAKSRVLSARHAADGILRLAEEEDADLIVLGTGLKRRLVPDSVGQTTSEVMRKAHCEVVVDKAPIRV